jgi:YD repeat-containing protein
MKKILLFISIAMMACLTTSCKKGEPLRKVYLLSELIIDATGDGIPIDTTRFFYDDQNRMILVRNSDGKTFPITYDDAGRVNIAKTLNANGSIAKEFDFFYTPVVGFVTKIPSKQNDTAYLTFDDKQQVSLIKTMHAGYSAFTYDERGNVASLKNYGQTGSDDLYDEYYYTYDLEKSYFADVAPNNYFLMYLLYPDANSLVNNVVTKNADVYTYTYNRDGFPVKAIAKVVGRSLTPIYYNYIVK